MDERISFEDDRKIDKFALDDEWKMQPELYYKWSERLANASLLTDRLKDALEVRKAQIDKAVRSSPKDFGLDKVTNEAINNIVILDEEYRKLTQEYIQAKYEENILESAVKTMEHKKQALENLVKLFLNNYYAEPLRNGMKSGKEVEIEEEQRKRLKERVIRRRGDE